MVGSYGYAAFIGGILGAGLVNRFERKRTMLVLVLFFGLSTLFCFLSTSFYMLVVGRCLTGAFGGLVGSMVMTIVSDLFPESRRGFAIGIVTTSFSVASVVGVPIGLSMADYFESALTPFLCLALFCIPLLVFLSLSLPTIYPTHAAGQHRKLMVEAIQEPRHWWALAFTLTLVFQTFLVVPYLATYCVRNVGMPEPQIKYIYIVGGVCTFFSMPYVGKLADRFGKLLAYRFAAVAAVLPMLLITNLPPVSVPVCILVTTIFMVSSSSRMVPAQALITTAAAPELRAGFLSISSAVQALGTGIASSVAARIVDEDVDHKLRNFWIVGVIGVVFMLASLFFADRVSMKRSENNLIKPIN